MHVFNLNCTDCGLGISTGIHLTVRDWKVQDSLVKEKCSGWTGKGFWKEHSHKEAKGVEKPKTSWANTGKKKQEDWDKHSSYFSTHTTSESLCHMEGRDANLLRGQKKVRLDIMNETGNWERSLELELEWLHRKSGTVYAKQKGDLTKTGSLHAWRNQVHGLW